MKTTFNKYWIIIALVIILNIIIFNFLSSKFENYIANLESEKGINN